MEFQQQEEEQKQNEEVEKTVYKNSNEEGEEISEKRTSKLGYILLFLMAFFVVSVGETIFADLKKIPEKPVMPSGCILSSVQNLERLSNLNCPSSRSSSYSYPSYSDNYNQSNPGLFNTVDIKFGLDVKFTGLKPQLLEIASINQDINSAQSEISSAEKNILKLNKDYDLSLQEKMAGEAAIMNSERIKNDITAQRTLISTAKSKVAYLERERSGISSDLTAQISSLEKSYGEAMDYYKNKQSWYKFKSFLLTLIFVLPFFAFSVFMYLRLKKKNSPYTIILTATTTAFSILLLQVVMVFLYDILPKEWLARIFRFFLEVPFLRYVIYYGSVLLVIGLFGGIVFYIQKRVFSPRKVAIRRLKDKKCPGCSFPINSKHNFCPDCGLKLQEECGNCGKQKIRYLSHCPNCGNESV